MLQRYKIINLLFISILLLAKSSAMADDFDDCLLVKLGTTDDTVTIGELKEQCRAELGQSTRTIDVVIDRIHQDRKHVLQPFTLMAHKPNYLLLGVYNSSGYSSVDHNETYQDSADWDNTEGQFQLSVKFPLLVGLFDDTFDVYSAYTNRSFWQVYNTEQSSPFRETNHEPELWVQFHPNWKLFGFSNAWNSFGVVHQSNGRSAALSRSWNRVYGWFTMERGNFAFSVKPWYRIPEDEEKDNNSDIEDFLGHFELSATYKYGENVISMMSRNNLESSFSKGGLELTWSFPLFDWPFMKGYARYYTGYGESLVDYDQYSNTIGLGMSLTDWL